MLIDFASFVYMCTAVSTCLSVCLLLCLSACPSVCRPAASVSFSMFVLCCVCSCDRLSACLFSAHTHITVRAMDKLVVIDKTYCHIYIYIYMYIYIYIHMYICIWVRTKWIYPSMYIHICLGLFVLQCWHLNQFANISGHPRRPLYSRIHAPLGRAMGSGSGSKGWGGATPE